MSEGMIRFRSIEWGAGAGTRLRIESYVGANYEYSQRFGLVRE